MLILVRLSVYQRCAQYPGCHVKLLFWQRKKKKSCCKRALYRCLAHGHGLSWGMHDGAMKRTTECRDLGVAFLYRLTQFQLHKRPVLSLFIVLFILLVTFRVRAEEKQCGANIFNKTKKTYEFLTHSKDEGHIAPINGVRIRCKFFFNYKLYIRELWAQDTRLSLG